MSMFVRTASTAIATIVRRHRPACTCVFKFRVHIAKLFPPSPPRLTRHGADKYARFVQLPVRVGIPGGVYFSCCKKKQIFANVFLPKF
jgi:hypothetical protein